MGVGGRGFVLGTPVLFTTTGRAIGVPGLGLRLDSASRGGCSATSLRLLSANNRTTALFLRVPGGLLWAEKGRGVSKLRLMDARGWFSSVSSGAWGFCCRCFWGRSDRDEGGGNPFEAARSCRSEEEEWEGDK